MRVCVCSCVSPHVQAILRLCASVCVSALTAKKPRQCLTWQLWLLLALLSLPLCGSLFYDTIASYDQDYNWRLTCVTYQSVHSLSDN